MLVVPASGWLAAENWSESCRWSCPIDCWRQSVSRFLWSAPSGRRSGTLSSQKHSQMWSKLPRELYRSECWAALGDALCRESKGMLRSAAVRDLPCRDSYSHDQSGSDSEACLWSETRLFCCFWSGIGEAKEFDVDPTPWRQRMPDRVLQDQLQSPCVALIHLTQRNLEVHRLHPMAFWCWINVWLWLISSEI